jgi:hypothetical protein
MQNISDINLNIFQVPEKGVVLIVSNKLFMNNGTVLCLNCAGYPP